MTGTRRAPRVVLDTKLVLSALIFSKGRPASLRLVWQAGGWAPLISTATTAELLRVLAYPKFKLSSVDQEELIADYLPYCMTVRVPNKPPATPACRDPFDVPFLQLAVAGKADYLVTGDLHLLSLAAHFECPIVTADQFMKTLESVQP